MTDFLTDLGPLALASRLRRLTDRLTQDVSHLYRALKIEFEPRWFPVFYLLSQKAPLGVVDIARVLGISHPAVNQIAGELLDHGLIHACKDESDKRKRLLSLSEKGEALLPTLTDIWDGVYRAVLETLDEAGVNLLADIGALEATLETQAIHQRFWRHFQGKTGEPVEIIPYQAEYQADFKRLNLEWIERHFKVEAEDERILNDPEGTILQPGGYIVFARGMQTGTVYGTCALLRQSDGSFELAKMAVTQQARGQGIAKEMLSACVAYAQSQQAPCILLETNSGLTAAIHLYTQAGFILQKPDAAHPPAFSRGDTLMRLGL